MTSSQTALTSSVGAGQLGLPDLAFVGKAGAGKTSAAAVLIDLLKYDRLSFAAPLKRVAQQLWGTDAATDRGKLQKLGLAAREIEQDTWVNLLLASFRPAVNIYANGQRHPIAVDDLRYENEWHALKGAGFTIVRVTAERHRRVDRLKAIGKFQNEEQLEHVSETAIDHLTADYTITNDEDRIGFESSVLDVVMKERKRR